jgi:polyisoprenoid-binding protein YceI
MTIQTSVMTTLAAVALTAAALPSQAATYAIEPGHTYVTFEAMHFGTSTNRGRFDKKQGTVEFDAAAKTGKVSVTIDMNSISTGFELFNSHLKGDNFFNAAKYPTAKFEGDKLVFAGDKVSEVPGQLTLLGKTKPVTLKAKNFNCYDNPMLKREVCGGDFSTVIKRSDWGMSYGLPGIPDDITLVIQVEAVKQ